mmetsp:Transcript_9967/g.24212  ORF Transcript_9967/g.24212 Transcript_9967/m.24212 type:complete len:88 (-) Transcript_9967:92-355(-)
MHSVQQRKEVLSICQFKKYPPEMTLVATITMTDRQTPAAFPPTHSSLLCSCLLTQHPMTDNSRRLNHRTHTDTRTRTHRGTDRKRLD